MKWNGNEMEWSGYWNELASCWKLNLTAKLFDARTGQYLQKHNSWNTGVPGTQLEMKELRVLWRTPYQFSDEKSVTEKYSCKVSTALQVV